MVSTALPRFWQQFPKAIEASSDTLRLRLFPGQFGDPFELQGGERKTHDLWFHFGPNSQSENAPLAWVHQPAVSHAEPDWYVASKAIPRLPNRADARLEGLLARVLTGPESLIARRETIDEYGWRHFGEVHADHEQAHYEGPLPAVTHYNNQYDMILGVFLQYCRTGKAPGSRSSNPSPAM